MAKNDIQILFDNEDIILINKPPGVSVTADRTGAPDILQLLNAQLSPAEPLRLVHRLDKETSGIMLLARHRDAQSRYSRGFAKREIKKLYLAIVRGPLAREEGIIKAPIARSQRNPQAMHIHPRRGKPAYTHWSKLIDFGQLVLLAAQPLTGRTHQIRIHMAHRGIPLAIDPVYARAHPLLLSEFKKGYRSQPFEEEIPLIERLTLHAYQLQIPLGPIDDPHEEIFTAPMEKKFAAAVKMLTKYACPVSGSPEVRQTLGLLTTAAPLPFPEERHRQMQLPDPEAESES